ncbi:MAG: hypothetical protein Q8R82_12450, partial [Hyphomonadaceae bacterium]|nr:hypothetical protein [Hyphomonadaceae bacterium]
TISAPQSTVFVGGTTNGNGVFGYGSALARPTETWNAANYFVDVIFEAASGAPPIVLDLSGGGLNLVSGVSFDFDGDGATEIGSWAGAGNAFLAIDRNRDGLINGISEISFVTDLPGAATDLEGLGAFDSNGDGYLSTDDQSFGDFLVWEDVNQDGSSQASELKLLADVGIQSIDLGGVGPEYTDEEGNVVHGSTEVLLASGATLKAYDVSLTFGEEAQPVLEADDVSDEVGAMPNETISLEVEALALIDTTDGSDTISFVGRSSGPGLLHHKYVAEWSVAANWYAGGTAADLASHADLSVSYGQHASAFHVAIHDLDSIL